METGSADEHITGRVQKELLLVEGTGWTAGHGGAPFPVRDAVILTVLSLGSRERCLSSKEGDRRLGGGQQHCSEA